MNVADSPRLKLERAGEYLRAINWEFARFIALDPWELLPEPLTDEGLPAFRVKIKHEIPDRLSLLIGDFVYNLRSSLDHLVWALLTHPPDRPEQVQFPIFDDEQRFRERAPRMIGALGKEVQDVIEWMQPYHRRSDHDFSLLLLLQRMSNIDKHRQIPLASAGISYSFRLAEGTLAVMTETNFEAGLHDGDRITMPDIVAPFRSQPEFKIEPVLTVVVRELHPGFGPGGFVGVEALDTVYRFVADDVFRSFLRFFK
ncbi:MAG: hypothetical protein IH959_02040 [Chloroflexi bacterium]|nr:hypothetical protein [Chloroflexota bacterium]